MFALDSIEQGGALLITAGASEAGLDGLYRTALAGVLPSQPTGQIVERAYRPAPSALGRRHPVVRGLKCASWRALVTVSEYV